MIVVDGLMRIDGYGCPVVREELCRKRVERMGRMGRMGIMGIMGRA